jgi:hypothetical protein
MLKTSQIHSEFIAVCFTSTMSAFNRTEKGNPAETECKAKGCFVGDNWVAKVATCFSMLPTQ